MKHDVGGKGSDFGCQGIRVADVDKAAWHAFGQPKLLKQAVVALRRQGKSEDPGPAGQKQFAEPGPLETGVPRDQDFFAVPKTHDRLPDFPGRRAGLPELFQLKLVPERIHCRPETVMLVDAELAVPGQPL